MKIKPARFTLRTLMIVVAVAAVALSGELLRRRWVVYRDFAAMYAELERDERQSIDAPVLMCGMWRPTPAQRREFTESIKRSRIEMVAYFSLLRRKYEYASSHPWIIVGPDPPWPG